MKVSVVMPVYNAEKYLAACLDSVLGQTLREIEVLCVDDGSTDGSAAVLARYAREDARVRLFASPHVGAYRAREVGIAASRGAFIHFMDSDDLLERDAYERLCRLAEKERLDQIVFSSSVFTDEEDAVLFEERRRRFEARYVLSEPAVGKILPGTGLMEALLDADQFFVSPPLRLIRGSLIRGHAWTMPRATSRADNYFTPLSLLLSARACAVSERYYRRRVRPGSISTAVGSEAKHVRNLLEVVSLYCTLPEFAPLVGVAGSPIERYAETIFRNIGRLLPAVPADVRAGMVEEVFADFPPGLRMVMRAGVFPFLARLGKIERRKPRRSRTRAFLSCVLNRLGI